MLLILLISAASHANSGKHIIINRVKPKTVKITIPGKKIAPPLKPKALALFTNPPDQNVLACAGSSTVLQATTSAAPSGYTNLIWSDGSTGSTLTVTSPGTYWWQETGPTVVANGDFSAGDKVGFTSSYTDVTTNNPNGSQLYPEAAYAIGTNPHSYHSGFYSYGDHTNGTGNMLIVNGASGASAANVSIWSENITIAANTDYVFSVWVRSASLTSPAILQFSINGTPLGGTITPTSNAPTSAWQYFTATWSSGSTSGSVPIALVNQNVAANGNDFAIDDIVFAPVYRQNIIVTNATPSLVLTSPHTSCGTYDLTQAISGYNTSTYTYTFKDSGGNAVPNPQAITQSGTYTITETMNAAPYCVSSPQTTTITINPVPVLSVTSPHTSCGSYDLTQAISSYNTSTYTYSFKDSGGNAVPNPQAITQSGTYTITETNIATGCVSAPQTTTVTINPNPVLSVTSPPAQCGGTYDLTQAISGYNTSTYTYTFKDSGGNVVPSPQAITQSGTYTITETNKTTGCVSAPQTVNVTINAVPVLSVTSPPAQCGGTYDLTQAINGWDPATYTYKDGSGNVLSRPTTVAASATYTITETNKTTGCVSAPQTVNVTINAVPVLSVTSPPAQCGGTYDLTQAISGYNTSTYTYTFKDSGGNVVPSPQAITQSGTYTITETNKTTGCISASKTVTVTINAVPVLSVTSPSAQCGGTYDLTQAINGWDPTTYTYKDGSGNVLSRPTTVAASATYTITETNKTTGCVSAPQTVNVTINPIPVLSVTSPPAQCGGTYDLTQAINGWDPTTYTYKDGSGNVLSRPTTVAASATYTITETNKTTGCVSAPQTVNVTINPIPVLSVTNPPAQCGGTYDLTQAINGWDPTTYTYKDGSGNVLSRPTTVAASATYTITETNKTTGCISTPQTVNVTINPVPSQPGITYP